MHCIHINWQNFYIVEALKMHADVFKTLMCLQVQSLTNVLNE